MHVFGHTHFGWDAVLDGVRYIQAALCYPQERKQRRRSIQTGPWAPGISTTPLMIWDGSASLETGAGAYWSNYVRSIEPYCLIVILFL